MHMLYNLNKTIKNESNEKNILIYLLEVYITIYQKYTNSCCTNLKSTKAHIKI